MTSKLIIATAVAILSLSTTAFAAGGDLPGAATARGATYGFDNTTLPENGSQGAVQSPNSLPPGFYNGTVQQLRADAATQWFAQQDERSRYAQSGQARSILAPRS